MKPALGLGMTGGRTGPCGQAHGLRWITSNASTRRNSMATSRNLTEGQQPSPVTKDPFTGTTPTGPIASTSGDPEQGKGWGIAARWFLFAIAIAFAWLFYLWVH